MVCKNCGKKNKKDALTCKKCGSKLEIIEEENKDIKEQLKRKSKKKIIIGIVAVFVVLAVVAGLLIIRKLQEVKIEQDWANRYYVYLTDAVEKEKLKEIYLSDDIQKAKINFIELTAVKEPVMVITYKEDHKDYTNFYYIDPKDKIAAVRYDESTKLEFLYNIEKKEYDYYLHNSKQEQDRYLEVDRQLEYLLNQKKETANIEYDYTFNKEDIEKVTDLEGKELTLPKKDQILIEVSVKEKKPIDLDFSHIDQEFKQEFADFSNQYQEKDDLITKQVKKETESNIEKIEKKKEQIEKTKEELRKKEEEEAKKKREEEERKRQEELAKGLKVGNYTLKYGTYVMENASSECYGTIHLNPNGKFHVKANCEGNYPYPTLDHDGTYTISQIQNSFTMETGLTFAASNGTKFSLSVVKDNSLSDQWHGYIYSGS